MKICIRNSRNQRSPKNFPPLSNDLCERFGLLIAGDGMVKREEIKREVADALKCSLQKAWPKAKILGVPGMEKDIEKNLTPTLHA